HFLLASNTCSVGVKFTPLASGSAGAKSASVSVVASPGGGVVVQLLGTALMPGVVSLTPATKDFTTADVNTTSAAQLFTLINNSASSTGTLSASLTGTDSGQFALSNDVCSGGSLAAAGGQCTIRVAFAPTSIGVKSAALTVTGIAGGPWSATLSG